MDRESRTFFRRAVGAVVAVIALVAVAAPAAIAQGPTDIHSSGPLSDIWIGENLECQVAHTGDASYEFFPSSSTTGNCGTFLSVDSAAAGPQLYGGSAAASNPFTLANQPTVSGAGTARSPYSVTTVENAGDTGLQVTEVDSYVVGNEYYRSAVTITNNSGAPATGKLYHAADCYLQGSDVGFGHADSTRRSVACTQNANNSPPALIEEFAPLTSGANYVEAGYSTVWSDVRNQGELPNTCDCTTDEDNGAGINWDYALAPGQSQTFSMLSNFSGSGVFVNSAPPPPTLGRSGNITPSGLVFAKLGGRFVQLTQALQLPMGTEIDALRGSVQMVVATGKKGKHYTGTFGGAVFKGSQARSGKDKGMTTLSIIEGAYKGAPGYAECKAKHAADNPIATTAVSSRILQTLRARATGRFRTRGRFAAGTVRGTSWNTIDRCGATGIQVITHSVLVTDFVKHRTVLVRAGHRYLAKAP